MLFKDYKIQEFIEDLSSDSPSPGGGSTAALVAALSGCLNSMVYSLTVGKKAFDNLDSDKRECLIKFAEECSEFTKLTIVMMEEDRKCFNELMESYKLPKETEEEKDYRKKDIKEKTNGAMKAPLNLLRACIKFYDNILFAAKYGNKMLVSDAGVSAILLHAAIESAIINVKINLNSLKGEEFYKDIDEELEDSNMKSLRLKSEILMIVDENM
ncbi:cyclodeaminase/cyclohydrolase family protein [Clostridium chrysemydis]|uniref:cyclodeaminase/cyclohydrolase family protein n=1 Tax=Clostridium chrysemydis TaxID=2665504 RepID=UPI0018841997|nr:cyclodeaminase/cyclohydrolase family protein [Clostridium chrysemydis]